MPEIQSAERQLRPRKVIITGGPSSGKSTLINYLVLKDYPVLRETSEILIKEFGLVPWDNQELFCETFRQLQIEREKNIPDGLVFLDRSLVDPVAYAEVADCPVNLAIFQNIEEAFYEREVFLLDPLPYRQDSHRTDTADQARAIQEKLPEIYTRLGFQVIRVPRFSEDEATSVKRRFEFVLGFLDAIAY